MARRSRKKKTEDISLEQRLAEVFAKSPYQPFNSKQLAAKLGASEREARHQISMALEQMLASAILVSASRGKYKLNPIHMEADVQKIIQGKISMKSPVGEALMGKKQGDTVQVQAPRGTITYEIVEVSY